MKDEAAAASPAVIPLARSCLCLYSPGVAIDVAFIAKIDSPRFCERLFAVLPDVMFCLKDANRCYRAVNQAFVERCGLKDTRRLIGRRHRRGARSPSVLRPA